MTISGRPVEIYALLGGQWPHSSYMVPGGVMCAPTLTDVTRAWSILEHFRRNWMEPIWLGCSFERYEEIKSYDDFLAWLDERPEHANSDLGMFWRMSLDIGLDKYGKGHGKYVSWGYLPHEDKYNKPTIDGRNAALIMKSGVYDGKTDTHKLMDQSFTREDTMHAWYDEARRPVHPFDRTTKPIAKNDDRPQQQIFLGDRRVPIPTTVASRPARSRASSSPAARMAKAGSIMIRSCSTCIARLGGASVALRHFARMHEGVKIYRQIEHVLRELRLGDRMVHQAD